MFEGTFHQERVGQPVSIQEQPRHSSYVWQLRPPDAGQVRGNVEPSLIYYTFLYLTGRQQDITFMTMGAGSEKMKRKT